MLNDSFPHQILTQCGCLSVSKQVFGPVSVWCCILDSHAVCLCVACMQAHGACVCVCVCVCVCASSRTLWCVYVRVRACMYGRCTCHLCAGCFAKQPCAAGTKQLLCAAGGDLCVLRACVVRGCCWMSLAQHLHGTHVWGFTCAHGTTELQATVTSAVLGILCEIVLALLGICMGLLCRADLCSKDTHEQQQCQSRAAATHNTSSSRQAKCSASHPTFIGSCACWLVYS
jgi:hypothetical protein